MESVFKSTSSAMQIFACCNLTQHKSGFLSMNCLINQWLNLCITARERKTTQNSCVIDFFPPDQPKVLYK